LLLLVALATVYPAAAQTPLEPSAPVPGQEAQELSEQPQIRVRVNVVDTPAVVRDAKGDLVLDLTAKNFRILDNGKLQKIEDFDMGGAPISLAIVLENSSRVEALLPAIRRTGILLTQAVLGENDDAAVVGYNDETSTLLDFTTDGDTIDKAVVNLPMGTSGAHLYDALSEAVTLLSSRPIARRRVIIAIAEATDTGSERNLGQVLQEAEFANITIYAVGLSSTAAALRNPPQQAAPLSATPPGVFGLAPFPGTPRTPTSDALFAGNADLGAPALWAVKHATETLRNQPLEIAATATGGLFQSTFHDNSIEHAIDQIGDELYAQYVLSYRPAGTDAGGYHKIKVELVKSPGPESALPPGLLPSGLRYTSAPSQ